MNEDGTDYSLKYERHLPEEFRSFAVVFEFKNDEQDECVIFTNLNKIMKYNFKKEELTDLFDFKNDLRKQPNTIVFDSIQNTAIIASTDDVLWVNIKDADECDIDEAYNLGDIKSIIHVEDKFYMLANKFDRKLGYFLLELPEKKPKDDQPPKFLIRWTNKLEIGDAGLHLLEIQREGCDKPVKELVVSYKQIYVNLYTVFVIEIETGLIKFRHENYQLWESPVMGFLNTQTNDFIVLNKDGTSFLPLGRREKKNIFNSDGIMRCVHSLDSCNYLKIEDSNHLRFMRAKNGETDRIVMV